MSEAPQSPVRPIPGVSAAIFSDNKVLLVKRAKGRLRGLWSLPGGHIEPGEKAIEAIQREIHEETNIDVEIKGLVDVFDVILRNQAGRLEAHYVLNVFYGHWLKGKVKAGGDSSDVQWLTPLELITLPVTDGLSGIVNQANKKLKTEL